MQQRAFADFLKNRQKPSLSCVFSEKSWSFGIDRAGQFWWDDNPAADEEPRAAKIQKV
jgi:hypothetical protein